jgi:hypothetical protein
MKLLNQTLLRSVVAAAAIVGLIFLYADITLAASNTSKKKTSPVPIPSKKINQPAQILPYLAVKRIYIKSGTVHLSIGNKSKGKLNDSTYNKATLSLHLGKVHKTWSLKIIDPQRSMNKGKSVVFNSDFKIVKQTRALVFFTNIPGKKKNTILSPPPAKQIKTNKKEKSIITPVGKIQSTLPGAMPIPDVVESCFCVEVVGHGTGGSVRGRDARGVEWNLEAPAGVAGALAGLEVGHFYEICGRQPDRSVVIGHPFVVTEHTETGVPCIEQPQCCIDDKLYPYAKARCKAQKGRYYRSPEEAEQQCLPGLKKGKSAITPVDEMRGTSPEGAQANISEGVPMLGRRAIIEIELPGRTFHIDETIAIQYRFTSIDDVVAGVISFTAVYKGSGDEIKTVTAAYDPLVNGLDIRETAMTFPDDAPEGLYSIIADQAGSEDYGESGPFWIYRESTSAAITFEQPYLGQRFLPGSLIRLTYYFSRPVEFGLMTFDLYTMESATPVSTATWNALFPSHYSRPGFRFFYVMRIPPEVSSDHCFIVATHPNGVGTSNTFIIQPIGDGGAFEPVP